MKDNVILRGILCLRGVVLIVYRCPFCGITCELSTCPVCGERADCQSSIYWCSRCNVPTFSDSCDLCKEKTTYIGTDLRPVFPQERLLLELILNKPLEYIEASVWYTTGNRYVVNGNIVHIKSAQWGIKGADKIRAELAQYQSKNEVNMFSHYVDLFVKANTKRYEYVTAEAFQAITDMAKEFTAGEMFVSFSGGKDSTVTSSLATRALGNPRIIHLYGNTTLEFPETEAYVKRFKVDNCYTPMLEAKNTDKNFYDMCEIIGPPSRVMRWCCVVFKTGAITKKIERTFATKKRILTFYGIRRSESPSRSKYERIANSPKIRKQLVFSPIIDWLDFDIWLYLLSIKIDFNDAYRYGYTRVGCWCCPNNSKWSEFLSQIYMPEQYKVFHEQLVNFANKVGKPDAEEYVNSGGWKARQGGNGLEVSKSFAVSFKPCAMEENSFEYELTKPISKELYELFKPFGKLDFDIGNPRLGEVYVLDHSGLPILKMQGRLGKTLLKVSILKLPFMDCPRLREAEMKIKCQLTKYQICFGCMACTSVCKHDAIRIKAVDFSYYYEIQDHKCVRCGKCVNHYDGGCYMRDVIRTKMR